MDVAPREKWLNAGGFRTRYLEAGDPGTTAVVLLHEVFENTFGRTARSFPAALPVFQLDRIYVRGFTVNQARVHHGHPWARISNHAALTASILRV